MKEINPLLKTNKSKFFVEYDRIFLPSFMTQISMKSMFLPIIEETYRDFDEINKRLKQINLNKEITKILNYQKFNSTENFDPFSLRLIYEAFIGITDNVPTKEFVEREISKIHFITVFTAWETYLYRCFKYILLKYPSILGGKQIKLKKILEMKNNIQELVEQKIDRELHDVFYGNLHKTLEYCRDTLNFDPKLKKQTIIDMEEVRQYRNLILHSNGEVNHIFLSKVKTDLNVGESVPINESIVKTWIATINTFIDSFDEALIKKFPELISREK